MDEQSIWKKEISFRRKPKAKPEPEPVSESHVSGTVPEAGPKESIWKREISLGRKPKKAKAEPEPVSESHVSGTVPEAGPKESVWKREISLGRKPKRPKVEAVAETEAEAPVADGHDPVSDTETGPEEPVWKRAVSFPAQTSRKAAADEQEPAAGEAVAETDAETEAEAPVADGHDPVSDTETGPEEPVWKRAVSFPAQTSKDAPADEQEPAALEAVAETDAETEADPPVADGHDRVSDTETSPEESAPTVSDGSPAAASEDVAADEQEPTGTEASAAPVSASATEAGPEETAWKKEVSFARKAERTDEVVDPVVEEEPAKPAADEQVWQKEVSFSRKADREEEPVEPAGGTEPTAADEPVAEVAELVVAEDPAAAERAALLDSWTAAPKMPPATVDEAPTVEVPAAEPAPPAPTVVHPPVPASELPPLPGEKVPFWKKDISFGGKKKEPKKPKESKERRTKAPKAPKVKADRSGGKGAKRLVGLKIGASQLAAARVANNGSAELLQVAREPLNPGIVVGGELRDPDALAEALKEFFAKYKLPKRGVRLGIANNRIGVRTFEIAGIDDQKQLANAIRFRAQEALPIPIDEAVLDYQILGESVDAEGQPTRRILLVVAYRELIDRYVEACRKAGIGLVGIDLEAFALLRALQAPQEGVGDDPSAALVAVAIGHERSTFAVSDGRVCEFTRVLEWGGSALNVAIARALNAAPSEVEGVKRSLTLTDGPVPEGLTPDQARKAVEAVRKAIQTFARELVSSLQYYQNQPGSLGIGEIVLTGGTAHLPGLAAELEGLIGVRVRVGDPLARMKVSKKVGDPEQIGSLAVAIGLGIED